MSYPLQFKENVVKMVLIGTDSQAQIAKDMGVPASTMRYWLEKVKNTGDTIMPKQEKRHQPGYVFADPGGSMPPFVEHLTPGLMIAFPVMKAFGLGLGNPGFQGFVITCFKNCLKNFSNF